MCHLKVRLGSSILPNLASACSVSLSRNTFEEQLGLHGQGCPLGGRRQGRTGSGPACNLRLMVVTPLIRLEHLDSRQENERRQTQEKLNLGNPLHPAPLSTPSLRTYYYRPSRRRLCGGCRLEDLVSDGSGQPGLEDHWSDGLEWPRGLGVHSLLVDGSSTHEIGGSNPPSPTKIDFHMK